MATQHLSFQAARDDASTDAQATRDPRSAQRNASAHQRENGHSHALWLLAVLAVTLVVGLLVSLLAPGASAVAAAEPDAPAVTTPVTWGVRPADTVHGTDRPNYAYGLDPGTSLDDAIIVSNYTEGPLTFRVYAADGYMTEAGELDLLPAGEESQALGAWVTFEADDVTIEGGGTAVVPFTVSVPADATPGDYAAGVVSSLLVENAEGVSVDRRLGSRMHLRVAGDLVPAVVVDDVSVTYDGTLNPFAAGDAVVTFTVTNDGNTRLAPGQSVRVAGPWGAGAQSAPRVELPEMLPGTSLTRTVTVDGVWPLGRVTGSVTVSAEVVTAIGAADAAPLPVAPATGSASTFAVPWSALALLVLAVGGVVLQRRGARRRRASDERKVAEAVAQALKERDEQPVG